MDEYKFSKGTIEKYTINWEHEWAVFTIDSNTGLMQCHSSYGDWSYSWPNHGRETFKHFLIDLERDWEYLLNKVSDKVFNLDKTIQEIIRDIIDSRKQDYISKDIARKAYDFIKSDDCQINSEDGFYMRMYENDYINAVYPDSLDIPIRKNWSIQNTIFAKTIWPMLSDILRKEIKEGADK